MLKLSLENYVLVLLRDAQAKHVKRFEAEDESESRDDDDDDDDDEDDQGKKLSKSAARKAKLVAARAKFLVSVEDCQAAMSELSVKFL